MLPSHRCLEPIPDDKPIGRNGGHLTPALVEGFISTQEKYGTEQTLKSYALENHTATEIVKVIYEHGLEEAVDLVEGGHISLLLTDKEVEVAKAEIAAAQKAGQDLSGLAWIDAEEMEKVSLRKGSRHWPDCHNI